MKKSDLIAILQAIQGDPVVLVNAYEDGYDNVSVTLGTVRELEKRPEWSGLFQEVKPGEAGQRVILLDACYL